MNDATQRIFISYRRSDCQPQANGLYDGLRSRLTDSRVFMDIDSIPPGADFEEHIRNEIEQCQVVLVLIGDNWLDPRPGTEVRRLDEPNDFVRLEVESSLSAPHVRIIPVLVEGAEMPQPDQLPESIRRLARLNAFELADSRWTNDIERLAEQLRGLGPAAVKPEAGRTASFSDLDEAAIRYALDQLPRSFATKDVSEHPAVLATHAEVSDLRNYHTIVGRYLMQHRHRLGLGEPNRPVDERGSLWTKTGAPPLPTPVQGVPQRVSAPMPMSALHSQPGRWARYRRSRWFMGTIPIISLGLAAWLPPVLAASRRKSDRSFQKKMYAAAGGLGLIAIAGFVMIGSAPTDSTGTATGFLGNAGGTLILVAMGAGAALGFALRDRAGELPGAEEHLARRQLRVQYRQLVARDRALAASMMVGRPDVRRDYDDGGLLDVNSLSADALGEYGGITSEEARRIVEVRAQLGRFVDLNEVTAYVPLSEATVTRLREISVFV